MKLNGALLTINILAKAPFLLLSWSSFSLCSLYFVHAYASCVWGEGMELFVYLKIVKIVVSIKTIGTLFCHWQRRDELPSKTVKGSHRMGGVRNLLKISAPFPLIRTFRMSPSRWTIPSNQYCKVLEKLCSF
jgi:hypothetical protein